MAFCTLCGRPVVRGYYHVSVGGALCEIKAIGSEQIDRRRRRRPNE